MSEAGRHGKLAWSVDAGIPEPLAQETLTELTLTDCSVTVLRRCWPV